ncbi:MAG: glucose-1-phosphate adenylyltransferase, partial [Gemmataceae bacterium]
PASRIDGASIDRVTIADGCVVGAGSKLEHSMLGVRSRVGTRSFLRDVVMIGSDRFENPADLAENRELNRPPFNIGDGCVIERAILDKDCRIGNNVVITDHSADPDYDDPAEQYFIRDGIVCIPRGAVIRNGTRI